MPEWSPAKADFASGRIRMLLEKKVSKASIAKIVGVTDADLGCENRLMKLEPEKNWCQFIFHAET